MLLSLTGNTKHFNEELDYILCYTDNYNDGNNKDCDDFCKEVREIRKRNDVQTSL